jgi:hypothetical protein
MTSRGSVRIGIDVARAPVGPAPRPALPAGFTAVPHWIAYEL